jgi:hypothetical protein
MTAAATLVCGAMVACNPPRVLVTDVACTRRPCYDANYIETAYRAVTYMLDHARDSIIGDDNIDLTRPVIWASTVNLNNYGETSNFGRLMGETLAIALQNHRQSKMIQMTLRQGNVPITPQGEFLLTRDMKDLATKFNAGAALVSSYSVAVDKVYVQCSLINVDQNTLVASVQMALPLGPRTEAMLKNIEWADDAEAMIRANLAEEKARSRHLTQASWPTR